MGTSLLTPRSLLYVLRTEYLTCSYKIALFTQSGIVGDSRPAPKSKPPRPERIHQ